MKRNRAERFEATRVMSEGVGCVHCSGGYAKTETEKTNVLKFLSELLGIKSETADSKTKLADLSDKAVSYRDSSSTDSTNNLESSTNKLKSFSEALGGLLKEQGVSTQKDVYAIVDKLGEQYGFSKEQIAAVKEELDKAKRQERLQVSSVPVSSNTGNRSLAAA